MRLWTQAQPTGVMQKDNNLKHLSKSTSKWLKKKKSLEGPSQILIDIRKTGSSEFWMNVADLKQFCIEEWAKIKKK